ncbi:MAG: hypothetical protein GWP61_12090 [Chloroflexi bacterium]|nr:hypothetical protein [Chloroflexota bacterium]
MKQPVSPLTSPYSMMVQPRLWFLPASRERPYECWVQPSAPAFHGQQM